MHGWINLNKPRKISSAQILNKLKKLLGKVKIGHAGTLDMEACGVLPVAIGEACKLTDFFHNKKKKYRFVSQFGQQTETGDIEGKIVNQTNNKVTEEEIQNSLKNFIGKIKQIPSKYSAIKVNGKRGYEYARSGQDVKIPEREIEIYSLYLINFDFEKQIATFECECSKGTYIRSLGEDIAFSLQNFSFVLELTRLQVGPFNIENSIDIEELLQKEGDDVTKVILHNSIHPVDILLDDIPVFDIDDNIEKIIRFGQKAKLNFVSDIDILYLRNKEKIISIGSVVNGEYIIKRVFNI